MTVYKSGWRRIILILIVTFVSLIGLYTYIFDNVKLLNIKKIEYIMSNPHKNDTRQLYCYKFKDESLQDISEVKPKPDRSIFFHETSCVSSDKGKIWMSPRQACAVESAAKMNPNMDVYLLFSSPGIVKFEGDESDRVIQALLSYHNINFLHLDFGKYMKDTPVEELYEQGLIEENADYAIAHASDILRYLTLWKYGGIYLDTDVVVLKSLENLPTNVAGAESNEDIAAGVFKFSSTGFGHKIVEDCLNYLRTNFNPYDWSGSSVGVISRIIRTTCNARMASDLFSKDCGEFKLYSMEYFYAIHYSNWEMFFDEKATNAVLEITNNGYAIHVWNKLSAEKKMPKTANTAYHHYARQCCPKVFAEVSDEF